jgi:hypothetical protein
MTLVKLVGIKWLYLSILEEITIGTDKIEGDCGLISQAGVSLPIVMLITPSL